MNRPPIPDPRAKPAVSSEPYARLLFRAREESVGKSILRETTLIGSSEPCHVQLRSEDVSPVHCVITLDSGRLRVRDLRSKTGTQVNGKPVSVKTLADGDTLRIGRFEARVDTNLSAKSATGFFVDRYQVSRILGAGGMSWSYVAKDLHSGEQVALKMLPKRHKPAMRLRFELEARAGAKLDHPNIARTLRIDHSGDVYYLVMEYVEGVSLGELVTEHGPLPPQQAADIAMQTARGLAHAHRAGVIHRDLKPANVLVTAAGEVKIIDFGLALLVDEDMEFSLAKIFNQDCVGTADFVAPEQALDSYAVDGRADIYSLGCTLFHALTGSVVYPQKSRAEKLQAHCSPGLPELRQRVDHAPKGLLLVLEKMLAKRPEARFTSAEEAAEALAPLAERRPVECDFTAVLEKRISKAKLHSSSASARRDRFRSSGSAGLSATHSPPRAPESASASPAPSSPGLSASSLSGPHNGVQSSASSRERRDGRLAQIIRAWPDLPESVKRLMLATMSAEFSASKAE